MNSRGQGKGAVIGLVALIAVAVFFIFRQVAPTRYTLPGDADWACEQCGQMFAAPDQWDNYECPDCGGEAVKTHMYYDPSRRQVFELYREKPEPGAHPGRQDPSERLFKVPGGEWQRAEEFRFPDKEGLVPAPPASEFR